MHILQQVPDDPLLPSGDAVGAAPHAPAALHDDLRVLKLALQREEQFRFSEVWQARFAAAEGRLDMDWLDVVAVLQEQVVREVLSCGPTCLSVSSSTSCGKPPPSEEDMRIALIALRTSATRYPDDPELKQISVYRRYNIARHGSLRAHDALPDCRLVDASGTESGGTPVSLHEWIHHSVPPGQPLLIIAGSWT